MASKCSCLRLTIGKVWRQNYAGELRGRHPTAFRDSPDIDSMQGYGLDLSSYEEVKARAAGIYACLADGSMPCDEPWPSERLAPFKRWMDEGMAP